MVPWDQILDSAKFAHVAVVSDGDPYVGPLSFVRYEDALYFRTGPGERVDALQVHPRAAASIVEFDDETGAWESVLVRGDINFLENDRSEDAIVGLFLDKYREYTSELGSGPRLDAQDAAMDWVGTPEVAQERTREKGWREAGAGPRQLGPQPDRKFWDRPYWNPLSQNFLR